MCFDGIAHFIYDSYFGSKSLAQRVLKHSVPLGCSRIPEYLTRSCVVSSLSVYCLILTNHFNKSARRHQRVIDGEIIAKRSYVLVNGFWQACYVTKMQTADDDESSSSSDNSDDEPEAKPGPKPAEKEEKKNGEYGKDDSEDKQ